MHSRLRVSIVLFGLGIWGAAVGCGLDIVGVSDDAGGMLPDATVEASPTPDTGGWDTTTGDASDAATEDAIADAHDANDLPDAIALCPSVCDGGVCDGGTCTIGCEAANSCPGPVVCPTGIPCVVDCTANGTCAGGVDCAGASTCAISCSGDSSCQGPVNCAGSSTCVISCSGNGGGSCRGPVRCRAQTQCNVTCSSPGSCDNEAGVTCNAPSCTVSCSDDNTCKYGVTVVTDAGAITCDGNGDTCKGKVNCSARGTCAIDCASGSCSDGGCCEAGAGPCNIDGNYTNTCP